MRIVLAETTREVASRTARFWFETIALVCGIACVLALLFAAMGAVAGAAAGEPESGQVGPPPTVRLQTFEGLLTDTQCGAKHSAVMGKPLVIARGHACMAASSLPSSTVTLFT